MGKKGRNVGRDSGRNGPPSGAIGASLDSRRLSASVNVNDRAARRVIIHSNAPFTGTGYGVQTAHLTRSLLADGVEVAISANHGISGATTVWEGVTVYPSGYHPYSADVLKAHWQDWTHGGENPAVLLTLFDVWVYKETKADSVPVLASWVPVDHLPVPPDVLEWCQRPNVVPIAMAKFGQQMLERAGVECHYAPHSVDTNVFRPNQLSNGMTGRQMLDVGDDVFLVGMFAANKGQAPSRKAFAENFLALSEFVKRHSDVMVYLHTEKRGAAGGIDLVQLATAVGLPEDRIIWVDQYSYYAGLDHRTVAALMASLDVNLLCSAGEGFGVPVLEAASCGTPSVVSDFSAQPELVEGYGWTVGGQPQWDPFQKAWLHTPNVPAIVDALDDAYGHAHERRFAARNFALDYDNATVYDRHWRPIIDELTALAAGGMQ